jgi:polar amino acid transport system substrate-binding protein
MKPRKPGGINIFIDLILTKRQLSILSICTKRRLKIRIAHALLASIALLTLVSCSPNIKKPASPGDIPTAATTGNLITLHYNERPPYLVTTDEGVGGLTGDPATIVFEKSNLPFLWKQTPSKRQIYLLQQNKGRDCLVGWFKNKEREAFARYTLPIYQDKPQIALARVDNDRIPVDSTVSDLFSDPRLNLLVKDGYSYGDFLDGKIKEYDPVRTVTTDENSEMLKMVFARHADYFFIAPEEADGLIRTSEFDAQDFKFIHFRDIPVGEKRYILCSLQVEASIIEQLNAAIRQYVTLHE